jgi:oligopeptide/dipeptide ABC transporter ATP-binding protein
MPLLRVEGVSKTFRGRSGSPIHAVNDVSLEVEAGETVALIGESGSGKSTTARLALGLQAPDEGTVQFDGQDLQGLDRESLRRLRARMTMVFQEPYASLNPRQTVGRTVDEPLRIHEPELGPAERRRRTDEALEQVSLSGSFYDRYPHEMSGGQQQRVGIARAMVTRPQFIVLDEPTSSLDLSVRAQVLRLLGELRADLGLAYLFVSHDIATVEYIADRICVMYLGQIVETGPVKDVFSNPQHPYTRALLSSTLSTDPLVQGERFLLGGEIPSPTDLPEGCFLHNRCPLATEDCVRGPVRLHPMSPAHEVACIKVPTMQVAGHR